ncbi:MAG TPA: nuclear transport factor 2 family protein [Pyrinomonadaceae bacterium]
MKRILLFSALILTAMGINSSATYGQQTNLQKPDESSAKAIAPIRAVLDAQTAAWNRGDIEGFMNGYWRSNETIFISGDTLRRGWDVVLEGYKKGYATRERMGTLAFSEIEIKLIGKDTAVAFGRWQLTFAYDPQQHGRFTLIFRKTSQGWRIVHDHTSSAS